MTEFKEYLRAKETEPEYCSSHYSPPRDVYCVRLNYVVRTVLLVCIAR